MVVVEGEGREGGKQVTGFLHLYCIREGDKESPIVQREVSDNVV